MPTSSPRRRSRAAPVRDLDALPSPTCAKTLAVLELVGRHPGGATAARVARESGITANLVFRILKTLVALGYCRQHADTKAYTLSGRLLELSGPKTGDRSLAVAAHETLRHLRDTCGETVQLLIESSGKGVVLEQLRGSRPLQVCGEVGMRVPLYSCAPGKAILAWWSSERRAEWLRGRMLKRFTAATLTSRAALEQDLEAARARGYAIDRAEGIDGIHCVAAPIVDAHGQPLAAVTIMAPLARLPQEGFAARGDLCIRAAHAIEAALEA
jgi:IclR family acetate operon transcriptional repressor